MATQVPALIQPGRVAVQRPTGWCSASLIKDMVDISVCLLSVCLPSLLVLSHCTQYLTHYCIFTLNHPLTAVFSRQELTVIRFQFASTDEKSAYMQLYSYLSTRNRCGVIGNMGRVIKDMYLVPLASHDPLPAVLLPFDGPGMADTSG